MKLEWHESQIPQTRAKQTDGPPGDLIYATRLLGKEKSFGLFRGANTSAKQTVKNLLGDEEEVLYINNGQQSPAAIEPSGFTALRIAALESLTRLEVLHPDQLANAIACSRILASAPVPPLEALTHAVLPYRYILRAQPQAVLSVACTPTGLDRLRQVLGERQISSDKALVIPYTPSGLGLARACAGAVQAAGASQVRAVYIQGHGLMTFGETARQAYERMVDLVNRAVEYLERQAAWNISFSHTAVEDHSLRQKLAALRKAVSKAAGVPLILSLDASPESASFSQRVDLPDLTRSGPAIAEHVAIIKRLPMIGRDVEAYAASYLQAFADDDYEPSSPQLDPAPRVILDPELGLCALGKTASETQLAMRIYHHTIHIMLSATALDGYCTLSTRELVEAEITAHWLSIPGYPDELAPFSGEIALVTGGASGIGKACVESLLKRGAAVVNLDINPKVKTLFEQADYLGLECDLTDEAAILQCFEDLARTYGGLDMLVLNAGIFPAGCRIEALSLQEWQRVMRINLDSNLVVLRESYPLLKQSPRGGRVLVNASKNVLAPGAGAAAYSASKAAVTQMARVAALEWGKDGIRVNLIHPDAIFDTGIWTEDVLKARAAHYGLTVQQYKTRNVLGVELNSHYVGELVAEMLGPRFEKITGAQIPVDGGSDRVI